MDLTTSLTQALIQSLHKLLHGLAVVPALSSLPAGAGRETREAGPAHPIAALANRAFRAARDIYALAREAEPRPADVNQTLEAELLASRASAAEWQARAKAAESNAAGLEIRLAEAELTALELRSRVICLHGKLATSTATVRYQTMTLALESQATTAGHPRH